MDVYKDGKIIKTSREKPESGERELKPKQTAEVISSGDAEIDFIPLKQYFGLDASDASQNKYLEGLLSYFKSKGITERGKMFSELAEIEKRLGTDPIGERQLPRIYRYVRLKAQADSILEEMSAYEKGNYGK